MPEPRKRPFLLLALLAVLAAADGIYLTLVHLDYELGGVGVAAACHRFSETGCSITAGRFGDIAGIPVATIGFGGAVAMLVLVLAAWRRRSRWEDPLRAGLVVLATTFVAASMVMAAVSITQSAWCPFCVTWYGINALIAWVAWRCRDTQVDLSETFDQFLGMPLIIATLAAVTAIGGTMAWYGPYRRSLEQQRIDAETPKILAELLAQPRRDIDLHGLPYRGPEHPEVTIVEFGDFQCPYCRRLWHSVEEVAAADPQRVGIAFAHFPLDHGCNPEVDTLHKYACGAAFAAECAGRQDRFWEYAEELFAHQDALSADDLLNHARAVGLDVDKFTKCIASDEIKAKISADIARGIALDIKGTPTFFINGRAMVGALPAPILSRVIDRLLENYNRPEESQ